MDEMILQVNHLSKSFGKHEVLKDINFTVKAGDVTSIEMEGSGYCVVQFLGRERDDSSYQTLTYRNIEVVAETTHNDEDDTDLPTEEQRAAAESEAQSLLEQWQSGDATAESFGTLAQENSDDESTRDNGGLNENANRDNLSSTLTDWLFANDRQAGDTTIVEVTDSSGNVTGYQILYLESFGEIRWKYQATNSLRTDDYNAWYEDLQASYPAELTEEGQNIPTQQ